MTASPLSPLHDRIRGCLVGVALGDALGMPWETCTHEEILEMTSGSGVTGLRDLPADHPRKLRDPRGVPLGETTDDWQLTRAVAASLIRCRGFHLFDQAAAHVEAFETSTRGWGGSTRSAMTDVKRWFDTRGREGRRPDVPPAPAPGRGGGNGVVMKLAPLACLAALASAAGKGGEAEGRPGVRAMVRALGRMSHLEEVSPDVGAVLQAVLEGQIEPRPGAVLALIEDQALLATLRGLFGGEGGEREPSADEVRARCGTSFLASESAAFCLATMLRRPDDFRGAVLEAINAGGDTDTNASIVGGLVGARVGLGGIDPSWVAAVPAAAEARGAAERLIEALSLGAAMAERVGPVEVVVDGTNFGGKTPLVNALIERLRGRGLRVETASPYREVEVWGQWDDEPEAAARQICAVMEARRAQAAGADVIVWDRGWPTCFVATRNTAARRLFLPLPRLTFILLNTAETTERKVKKYGLTPGVFPWMFRRKLRDEISYEDLCRHFADDVRPFRPTLDESRFDLALVSGEIEREVEAELGLGGRSG